MTRRESSARSWSSRLVAAACIALVIWPAMATAKPAKTRPSKNRAAQEQAAALSQVAAAKNEAGDFKLCAEFYHQAYRTDPTFLGYLFSAARCEQKAGDLDAAERDFRQFLARAPKEDELVAKASAYLDEILAERQKARPVDKQAPADKPAPVEPPAAVTPVQAPSQTPPSSGNGLGWAVLGGGAALAAVGAYLVADGLAARAALEDDLALPQGGIITKLSPSEARDRESSYRTRLGLGGGLVGLGVAALGAGVWLLVRTPSDVAVAPALLPSGQAGRSVVGLGLTLGWR